MVVERKLNRRSCSKTGTKGAEILRGKSKDEEEDRIRCQFDEEMGKERAWQGRNQDKKIQRVDEAEALSVGKERASKGTEEDKKT